MSRNIETQRPRPDYHHVEQVLLEPQWRTYSESYWQKRVMSPSSLLFYIGLSRKIPNLEHHNLFFDEDIDTHVDEIYTDPAWPSKPLFYASVTTQTEPGCVASACDRCCVVCNGVWVGLCRALRLSSTCCPPPAPDIMDVVAALAIDGCLLTCPLRAHRPAVPSLLRRMAPEGCDALFLLVPLAADPSIDTEERRESCYHTIMCAPCLWSRRLVRPAASAARRSPCNAPVVAATTASLHGCMAASDRRELAHASSLVDPHPHPQHPLQLTTQTLPPPCACVGDDGRARARVVVLVVVVVVMVPGGGWRRGVG
eukprot:COSAG01_NODE_4349_length_5115_cov_2.076555_2_plen_312_part_00